MKQLVNNGGGEEKKGYEKACIIQTIFKAIVSFGHAGLPDFGRLSHISKLLLHTILLLAEENQHTLCCILSKMSLIMRKPDFGICENKDADQLRGNRKADQRLCFRYTDSTIPVLPKSEISSL